MAMLVAGSVIVAVSLLGFLDGRLWIAEVATSVRGDLVLVSLGVGLLALAVRSAPGIGMAILALVLNAVVLVPLYTNEPEAAVGADRLLIAHVNMQHHYGDISDVRRVLDRREPHVLVVLEPSRGWLGKLLPSPVGYQVYLRGRRPEPRVLVFASPRVSNVEFSDDGLLPAASVTFDVKVGKTAVHVLALHTAAPWTPRDQRRRDKELVAAADWARRRSGATVVLGDLNATPWSKAIRKLEDFANLRNSAYGYGFQATWRAGALVLGIPIDQLLHSRELTVTKRETGTGFGSKHRSLWVTIARSASPR